MAKFANDGLMDAGLAYITGLSSPAMHVCSGEPTTRAEVITNSLGTVTPTFTGPADGDTSGRKLTVDQKTGVSVTTTGTAAVVAIIDGTSILGYKTNVNPTQGLTSGNTMTIPAWDIEIADSDLVVAPIYAAPGSARPVPMEPLDPDEVKPFDFDWQPTVSPPRLAALNVGETIAEAAVTVGAGLLAGDGVAVVATEAGNVTPDAVNASLEAGTLVRVWLYVDPVAPAVEGDSVIVECTVRTSLGRVLSRSMSILVQSR